MKFDLYFWPIREQAWVLSWGLKAAMQEMGVLHRSGNIEDWMDKSKIPHLLNTNADVILFVGLEHFRKKIPTNLIKHSKAKIACWTYESLTDPYGAACWNKTLPNNFLHKIKEFNTGFTKMSDKALEYFDCIDVFFCADDLDFDRFKGMGRNAFWLPFGVDPMLFQPDARLLKQEKNIKAEISTRKSLVERAKIRYGTRYGIRSGRNKPIVKPEMAVDVRSNRLLPGRRYFAKGAFVGTKSNIRVMLLNRLGLDITQFQTPRKGSFGIVDKAVEHTKNLARAYNSFLMSFNLRSIFAGVTPRAAESMACGRLLFQYLCPPDRPLSRKLFSNCIKYEILSKNGLNNIKNKYQYYLAHPAEAHTIGNKAREEILMGHTLKHRVQTMMDKIALANRKAKKKAKEKE
jgi:spore maturation protein CgeB